MIRGFRRLWAWINRPASHPDHDPILAITWALDCLDDDYDRVAFLNHWRQGDLSGWSDYSTWVAEQRGQGI